jgi:hypothetical protein
MADLIQRDETKQKAIKVELPDGTAGELPIMDASDRVDLLMGYGPDIETYKKGGKIKKKSEKKYL